MASSWLTFIYCIIKKLFLNGKKLVILSVTVWLIISITLHFFASHAAILVNNFLFIWLEFLDFILTILCSNDWSSKVSQGYKNSFSISLSALSSLFIDVWRNQSHVYLAKDDSSLIVNILFFLLSVNILLDYKIDS